MNREENEADSIPVPKELKPQPAKWLAIVIAATLVLIGTTILPRLGNSIFDTIVEWLGKPILLQLVLVLLCSLGYCIYLIVSANKRKLEYKRALYWAKEDKNPFCPHCFENDKKRLHLTWKPHHEPDKQAQVESWVCYSCDYDFVAWNSKDFGKFLKKARIR
jgi:hypothetical protein